MVAFTIFYHFTNFSFIKVSFCLREINIHSFQKKPMIIFKKIKQKTNTPGKGSKMGGSRFKWEKKYAFPFIWWDSNLFCQIFKFLKPKLETISFLKSNLNKFKYKNLRKKYLVCTLSKTINYIQLSEKYPSSIHDKKLFQNVSFC